jgi:hypothetical protein
MLRVGLPVPYPELTESSQLRGSMIRGVRSRSVVLITCPSSGDLVATGVLARVLDELPALNVLLDCERCGEDHEWTHRDAVV